MSIRIGVIGAGTNTRLMHIPRLQQIAGVTVQAVCNRSVASAQAVCREFNIPEAVADPHALLARDDLDAIVIGTWPYKHAEYAIAALEHGKHVLTEARLAMNAAEAEQMLAASRRHPRLVAQVVPAPFTLAADPIVADLATGIGRLLAVHALDYSGTFPDAAAPFTWRHDRRLSGNNIMMVGVRYEALLRWVGPVSSLVAQADVVVRERRDPATGQMATCEIPDVVAVLGRLERDGAQFSFHASNALGFGPPAGCWIHGSEGTIYAGFDGTVQVGRRGEKALTPVDVAAAGHPGWRVEESFIGAIRGEEPVRYTTWADGVRYMRFTDAIHASVASGQRVTVAPLNP